MHEVGGTRTDFDHTPPATLKLVDRKDLIPCGCSCHDKKLYTEQASDGEAQAVSPPLRQSSISRCVKLGHLEMLDE